MKKGYIKPTIEIENFEANEYVAACYSFKCDVKGDIYQDSNKNNKLDWGDKYLGTNDICDATFTTDDLSNVKKAFDSKGNTVWIFSDASGDHAVSSVSNTDNHS